MVNYLLKSYYYRIYQGNIRDELIKYNIGIPIGDTFDSLFYLFYDIIPTAELLYYRGDIINMNYLIDLVVGKRNRNLFIQIFLPNRAEELKLESL